MIWDGFFVSFLTVKGAGRDQYIGAAAGIIHAVSTTVRGSQNSAFPLEGQQNQQGYPGNFFWGKP